MIFLTLEKNGDSVFIYQQIYRSIKKLIFSGKLKTDEKLPSKRELANQLEVSVNSVANAYEQLLAEGYIYTLERKGYYVDNITRFTDVEDKMQNKLPIDLKEDVKNREGWLSLSHMASDISLFPINQWMKYQQKAVKNFKNELSEITHPQGPYIVRQTISHLIARSRGIICEPEQIVIGSSTQTLIGDLMRIQPKGTIVATEDPGYSRFYTLLKSIELKVLPIALDEKGIDIKKVESSNARFLFVTPSHQFPTGNIMPISRRIELLNWSAQLMDRYIVEDDYDSEFKYETDIIPSLQSLDRNSRVIYTGTFSKTMFPGIRISYLVLPPDLLREYRRNYADLMQSSHSLGLLTLHYFIENGDYERHVKRMNSLYASRRKHLIKYLSIRFGDTINIIDVPAGLHFLAQFKTSRNYDEIENSSIENKLEIYTIRRFLLKNKKIVKNRIDLIIGFANIKEEDLVESVDRLYKIINY